MLSEGIARVDQEGVLVIDQKGVLVIYQKGILVMINRLPCMTDPALAKTNSMSFPLFARVPT